MQPEERSRPAANPGGSEVSVATATKDTVPLTGDEQRHLDALEQVVVDGIDTFVAVGTALAEIKNSRLYRQTHTSFEKYLTDRYDGRLTRVRAYQLIDGADVSTAVDRLGAPAPTTERHARELTNLPPSIAAKVMETVTNSGEKVTADAIAAARDKILADQAGQDRARQAPRPRRRGSLRRDYQHRVLKLQRAVSSLDKLSEDDRWTAFTRNTVTGDRADLWRALKQLVELWEQSFEPDGIGLPDGKKITDSIGASFIVDDPDAGGAE